MTTVRLRTKRAVKRALQRLGLDVRWYVPRPPHDLFTLLERYGVDAVFDIGANTGASGEYLRNIGFKERIVSYEPIAHLYDELARKASRDPKWFCENSALGEADGVRDMHVTGGGGVSSSFLASTGHMEANAPELRVIGRQPVKVTTLRAAIDQHYPTGDRLLVKIDAQGYERPILEGAGDRLSRVVGMRLEMSLVQSYQAEPLIGEMLGYVYGLGYRLCAIEEAWSNRDTHEVFQVDAVVFRTDAVRP